GALATTVPGVDVRRVDVLDRHSGTTGRLRLGLQYGPGPAGPATVFVKLPPFDESQRRIPQPYHAAFGDEPTEYVMVLEDLQASGCSFTTRLEPGNPDRGLQLVE